MATALYPHLEGRRIILASQSPRRRELIGMLGLDAECVAREVDESWPLGMEGTEVARHVATNKATAYADMMGPNDILITGDTVVVLDGSVLEKPMDSADAARMLRALSGQTHTVASAVAVTTLNQGTRVALDLCTVEFGQLTDAFIDTYIDTGSPMDKAGAYGVQDVMGLVGVHRLEGSFYTVMGLPTHRLHQLLLDTL
ncbi:MAG: Maf family protein [Bacteroidetes bacterium]|nr:Maf family protein [Bacteroidota bacterium]MDA0904359.1 Maf family protein [Bacteroidota bacterium]MDA1243092.1 Maf family protein [Bacteroidota bacterium]